MTFIEILVVISDRSHKITIAQDSSVDSLMDEIAKEVGIEKGTLRVVFGNRQLEQGKGRKLSHYEIVNLSVLVVVCRLPRGYNPLDAVRIKKAELVDLPGYIQVIGGIDMISLEEGTCAKMPCGHTISPSSMTSYAQTLLSAGKFTFMCPVPGCKTPEWLYFIVRHVACLSPDEKQKFEKNLAENYIKKAMGLQRCPGCSTWCSWQDKVEMRVACPYCKKHKPSEAIDFCWVCLKPWKSSNATKCGNEGCDGTDPRIKMLEAAPKKKIYKVECPSLRACPECGILIQHDDGCKHMECSACSCNFCFVCLKTADGKGKFKCGSYMASCPVAPIQQISAKGGVTSHPVAPSKSISKKSQDSGCAIM